MDDWPPDDTIIDDEERPEPGDDQSSQRQARFSLVVGDALESGPRNDRLERML